MVSIDVSMFSGFSPKVQLALPFLCLTVIFRLFISPGQQEDEKDPGRRTASQKRAGEDCPESSEEHERPDLGRD